MSAIDEIKEPIREEMKSFEVYFRNTMRSKVALLDIIMHYILRRKGKQMRPMLVFLTARLNGEITPASYVAASLIELLHTATLIHDDVVDEANERRGFFSINALWKNKVAVLAGDYLLSKGLLLSIENNETELLRIVSTAVKEMSEGELLQIEKSRKLNITEETYFEIIRKKTATLISSCTACGAHSAGAGPEEVEKMRLFGEYVGIAFQIRDDIFDYQKKGLIGKPTGNDLKEKKLTLPIIHALKKATDGERKHIIKLVKSRNRDAGSIGEIIRYATEHGGIQYATEIMNEYRSKALEILESYPPSPARGALTALVDYTTSREL